jgi:hypothetical protein
MKATLEFDLDHERDEYTSAINGWRYKGVIDDLLDWLRNKEKWESTFEMKVDEARQKIMELMRDNEV